MLISKPWGSEEVLFMSSDYMVKRLFMKKDCQCSYQYHEKKTETVYVVSGLLELVMEDKVVFLHKDDHYTITPTVRHRMRGVEDTVYLEASTTYPDDVIRIEDDYGRV